VTAPDRTATHDTLRDVTRLHGSICGACQGLTNLFETGRLPPGQSPLGNHGIPGMGHPMRGIEDLINGTKLHETKRNTKEAR